MRTKVRVSLNNTYLDTLDSTIVLQGVEEQAPSWNLTAASRGGLVGQHYVNTEKRYRDVIVSFAIREISDLAKRQDVYNKVCAWAAAGGSLKLSYRSNMELRVKCVSLPALGNVQQWANPMQMTFRAYDIPQWIDTAFTTVTQSTPGTNVSAVLQVTATGGGKLSIEVFNSSSSTCNSLTISSTRGNIAFSSLGLESNEVLRIAYTENDIQVIQIQNGTTYRSAMDKRTVDSSDDIWLSKGNNTIRVYANVAVAFEASTKGRWE